MIILPAKNQILQDTCLNKFTAEKREACDVTLYDFDEVTYKVLIDSADKGVMNVKMMTPYWKDIKDFGGQAAIEEEFGDLVSTVSDDGPELKIVLDDVKEPEGLAEKIGRLKSTGCGGPWKKMVRELKDGKECEPLIYNTNAATKLFLLPKHDPKGSRVVTIFALDFSVKTDRIIAETVLTEFAQVRKKDRSPAIQSGPFIAFSKKTPMELANLDTSDCAGFLGYLTVAISVNSHCKTDEQTKKSIDNVLGFRSFLLYHLKCAKAHFHQTMRGRVKDLLYTLKQATPGELTKKATRKKKASGH